MSPWRFSTLLLSGLHPCLSPSVCPTWRHQLLSSGLSVSTLHQLRLCSFDSSQTQMTRAWWSSALLHSCVHVHFWLLRLSKTFLIIRLLKFKGTSLFLVTLLILQFSIFSVWSSLARKTTVSKFEFSCVACAAHTRFKFYSQLFLIKTHFVKPVSIFFTSFPSADPAIFSQTALW